MLCIPLRLAQYYEKDPTTEPTEKEHTIRTDWGRREMTENEKLDATVGDPWEEPWEMADCFPTTYRGWEEILLIWAAPMLWFYLMFFLG